MAGRQRLAVVTDLFPFPDDPTRGVFNLRQFAELPREIDTCVFVPVPWPLWRRRFWNCHAHAGVETRYFPFLYPPRLAHASHAAWLWWSLRTFRGGDVRRFAPTCVLGSFVYPNGVAARRLADALHVPLILKAHGSDLNVKARDAKLQPLIASALSAAAAVVAVSRPLADVAKDLGTAPERVVVIENGVDTDAFSVRDRQACRLALGWSSHAPTVLYAGNLKQSKGCLDLLEAVAIARRTFPGLQVVYVGDGPERGALARRAERLGIAGDVHFTGRRPPGELPDFMNAADLLALPSHAEGIPNVVLEAMACGTPVVASTVGGIPDIVPPACGTLVPPCDVAELAKAICVELARPKRRAEIAATVSSRAWRHSAAQLGTVIQHAIVSAERSSTADCAGSPAGGGA
jgi:glycosyltransferase involved in cell wall biosynthesis